MKEKTFSEMRNETLVYIINKEKKKVLLIYKKRGFGKGKWNGVGGKVEEDESIEDGAIREIEEEIGIKVDKEKLQKRGILLFYNEDTHNKRREGIVGHVFIVNEYEGKVKESDEAKPKWWNLTALPYNEMWEDDVLWLPYLINGNYVIGEFYFKDWKMYHHELYITSPSFSDLLKYAEDNKEYCEYFKRVSINEYIGHLTKEIEELKNAQGKEELIEELGDVVHNALTLMYKYQLDKGLDVEEVINSIIKKMRRRKPHVFNREYKNLENALKYWHEEKRKEHKKINVEEKEPKNREKDNKKRNNVEELSQNLRQETQKWLERIKSIERNLDIKEIKEKHQDMTRKEYIENIKAYIRDTQHFLNKNMLIEAFEAVIWAWAWYEIGIRVGILDF